MTAAGRGLAWVWGKSWEWKKELAFWLSGLALSAGVLLLFASVKPSGPASSPATEPDVSTGLAWMSMAGDDKTSGILFYTTVFNAGSPTVLRDWKLTITSPAKEIFTFGAVLNTPSSITIPGMLHTPSTGTNATLERKDWLVDKTYSNPIPDGGMAEGYVLFIVTNLGRGYLEIPNTSFELSFKDVKGRTHTITHVQPFPPHQ